MRNLKGFHLLTLSLLLLSCKKEENSSFSTQEDASFLETLFAGNYSLKEDVEKLKAPEYVRFIENKENGLYEERVIEDLSYTVQYKPVDYVALKTLGPASANSETIKKSRKEYDGMQYFNFTIAHINGSDDLLKYKVSGSQEYQERVNYVSFLMQNDLMLLDGKDTLACKLFHYERVYGIAPQATFLLAFELPKKESGKEDKVLVYRDRLFGNSLLKFKIKKESLTNIPELIF